MKSQELIKKELEKQILLLSKLSEKSELTVCQQTKIAHEISQMSYIMLLCEDSINRQILSSCAGRASQGRASEQT